jgi:hypothetical protein
VAKVVSTFELATTKLTELSQHSRSHSLCSFGLHQETKGSGRIQVTPSFDWIIQQWKSTGSKIAAYITYKTGTKKTWFRSVSIHLPRVSCFSGADQIKRNEGSGNQSGVKWIKLLSYIALTIAILINVLLPLRVWLRKSGRLRPTKLLWLSCILPFQSKHLEARTLTGAIHIFSN